MTVVLATKRIFLYLCQLFQITLLNYYYSDIAKYELVLPPLLGT